MRNNGLNPGNLQHSSSLHLSRQVSTVTWVLKDLKYAEGVGRGVNLDQQSYKKSYWVRETSAGCSFFK